MYMTLINDKDRPTLQYLTADNIHSPKVTAIFATRNGGVSGQAPGTEHLSSLNFKFDSEGENSESVAENYRIIAASQGFCAENFFCLRQAHTDRIIIVDDKKLSEKRTRYCLNGEADALITNIKGILLAVRTADCVPILLYDSMNGAVGAVHAGWRGTFAQIGAKTVRRMTEIYGTNPADIQAAIGPAIGSCCYEVDVGFYQQFHKEYGDEINKFFILKSGSKPLCDLKTMNKSFLIESGLSANNIEVSELCTMCNPELFFSHRRSGSKRGTMASFIGMNAGL